MYIAGVVIPPPQIQFRAERVAVVRSLLLAVLLSCFVLNSIVLIGLDLTSRFVPAGCLVLVTSLTFRFRTSLFLNTRSISSLDRSCGRTEWGARIAFGAIATVSAGTLAAFKVYGAGDLTFLPAEDNAAWLQVASTLVTGDRLSTGFGFGVIYFLIFTRIPTALICVLAGIRHDSLAGIAVHVIISYTILYLILIYGSWKLVKNCRSLGEKQRSLAFLALLLINLHFALVLSKSGHLSGLLLGTFSLALYPNLIEEFTGGKTWKLTGDRLLWLATFTLWLPTHYALTAFLGLLACSKCFQLQNLERMRFLLSERLRILAPPFVAAAFFSLLLASVATGFEVRVWARSNSLLSFFFFQGGTGSVPAMLFTLGFVMVLIAIKQGQMLPDTVKIMLGLLLTISLVGLTLGQAGVYGVTKLFLVMFIPLFSVATLLFLLSFKTKPTWTFLAVGLVFLISVSSWRSPTLILPTVDFVQLEYGFPDKESLQEDERRSESWRNADGVLSRRVTELPTACLELDRAGVPRPWFEGYLCSRFLGWTAQPIQNGEPGVSSINSPFRAFGTGGFTLGGLIVRAAYYPPELLVTNLLAVGPDGIIVSEERILDFLVKQVRPTADLSAS